MYMQKLPAAHPLAGLIDFLNGLVSSLHTLGEGEDRSDPIATVKERYSKDENGNNKFLRAYSQQYSVRTCAAVSNYF